MCTFAGRDWYYNFREIDVAFAEEASAKVASRLLQR